MLRVKAEKELNVLEQFSANSLPTLRSTYPHAVCCRTEKVANEEVAKFYRIEPRPEKPPLLLLSRNPRPKCGLLTFEVRNHVRDLQYRIGNGKRRTMAVAAIKMTG
jgi:hypothetical protein